MVHVYLLKDGNGKVVDVGESIDPPNRLYMKTKQKPKLRNKTNFYGRTDITQEVVSSHPTRKEARTEEGRLKLFYGLEWTELGCGIAGSKNWPSLQKIDACKHCGKEMNLGNLKRYHNDNCKWK